MVQAAGISQTRNFLNCTKLLNLSPGAAREEEGTQQSLAGNLVPWFGHTGLNCGPLPCQGSALPLSYARIKKQVPKTIS